jgi:hypothetical protein
MNSPTKAQVTPSTTRNNQFSIMNLEKHLRTNFFVFWTVERHLLYLDSSLSSKDKSSESSSVSKVEKTLRGL